MATVEPSFPTKQELFANQDLFDNGVGDDSSSGVEDDTPLHTASPKDFSENFSTEKKRRRRAEKVSKPKKSDIQKMHSETQRLIRESSLKLPKYQPKVKTLDSFLVKLTKNRNNNAGSVPSINKENVSPNEVVTNNPTMKDTESQSGPDPAPPNHDHTPTSPVHPAPPPTLHSFDSLEMAVEDTNPEVASIEYLKRRFVKHATLKKPLSRLKKPTDSASTTATDSTKASILSEDEASQPGLAPGVIRQKLKQKLQKELSKAKAQERKLLEERRRIDNEEEEDESCFDELSKLEARLDGDNNDSLSEEEEESDGEGLKRKEEPDNGTDKEMLEDESESDIEEDGEEESDGSGNISEEGSDDDDDVYFVPPTGGLKRNRIIESDNEEEISTITNDLPLETSHDINTESPDISVESHDINIESHDVAPQSHDIKRNPTLEEASMGPLIFNEGTIDHVQSLDYPTDNLTHTSLPYNEDSQLTEIVNDDCEEEETSYHTETSLLPPHQIPRTLAGIGFGEPCLTTPSMTRQSSTFSDKDVFRGLETHPPPTATNGLSTQISSTGGGAMVDEETQFLDANGFLCIPKKNKVSSAFSAIAAITSTDVATPSTQQLMELCSGTFHSKPKSSNSVKSIPHSNLFNDSTLNMDKNTSDLLKLCSGVFPTTQRAPEPPIHSHNTTSSSSDSDKEEEMPHLSRKRRLKHKKPKNSERLQDFVESEAELSGSDIGGSDEEEEGGVSEDTYEEEAGSDVPLSDSELKDQVNKVHLKQLAVEDKADIRKIQDRFLLEGDLYEDGLQMKNGFFRTRHFANGSETSQDLFAEDRALLDLNGNDDGAIPLGSQAEAKRRKERLEKEEFIKRNLEGSSLLEYDQDSQSILELIKETSNQATPTQHVKSLAVSLFNNSNSIIKNRRGSFLKHKALDKLATTPQQGKGSGRGYVFQTGVTPTAGSSSNDKKQQLSSGPKPPGKKPCFRKSISLPDGTNSRSIFDTLK